MAGKQLQLRRPISQGAVDSTEIETIINRGGSSPTQTKEQEHVSHIRKSVIVYFDPAVLDRVDRARRLLRIKTSRQRWLMEAILEKLDRSTEYKA
jgi:hypothetical protein